VTCIDKDPDKTNSARRAIFILSFIDTGWWMLHLVPRILRHVPQRTKLNLVSGWN